MPVNLSMFLRRADQDPQAARKTGVAKMIAGWRLMLRDDRDALAGRTSRKQWWSDRKRLRDG
jgi:hypothetical protein